MGMVVVPVGRMLVGTVAAMVIVRAVVVVVRAVVVVVVRAVRVIVRAVAVVVTVRGHDRFAPARARSIRPAANAAPKPLSMLQTVTPDAQLLSMPRSAARPPNAEP